MKLKEQLEIEQLRMSQLLQTISSLTNTPVEGLETIGRCEEAILKVMEYKKKKAYHERKLKKD